MHSKLSIEEKTMVRNPTDLERKRENKERAACILSFKCQGERLRYEGILDFRCLQAWSENYVVHGHASLEDGRTCDLRGDETNTLWAVQVAIYHAQIRRCIRVSYAYTAISLGRKRNESEETCLRVVIREKDVPADEGFPRWGRPKVTRVTQTGK